MVFAHDGFLASTGHFQNGLLVLSVCGIIRPSLYRNKTRPVRTLIKKNINSEFFRFLLVGVSNTLVTYVVYLLLLPFLFPTVLHWSVFTGVS